MSQLRLAHIATRSGGPALPGSVADAITAGRQLTSRDRELIALLADHRALTTDQIARLFYGHDNTARKRLALLMAFLEDAPIFVFDEWAADQDPEFRKVFYFQVLPELRARGKAVVVISHDERYFHVGDRIVHLEYGRLVEEQPVQEQSLALA